MKYIATADGRDFEIDVDRHGEVVVDGAARQVDLRSIDGQALYSLILDSESYEVFVERRGGVYYMLVDGDQYAVDVEDARLKRLKAMGGQEHAETVGATIEAPMPGLVVKVLVAPGDAVEPDTPLVILEAMKMENELRSPIAGVVKTISAAPDKTVNQGDVLVVVEPE